MTLFVVVIMQIKSVFVVLFMTFSSSQVVVALLVLLIAAVPGVLR